MDEDEEVQPTYQVGDRVVLADEDLDLSGTVIAVDLAGQITVAWDDWYTHPDQVRPA